MQDFDLIFFHARKDHLKDRIIAAITGDPIHVGIYYKGYLFHASKEKKKVVLEPFDPQDYPITRIRISKELNRKAMFLEMIRQLGRRYGYFTYITILFSVLKINPEKIGFGDSDEYSPHCAALVSKVFRKGGVDLVPELPDVLTTPRNILERYTS